MGKGGAVAVPACCRRLTTRFRMSVTRPAGKTSKKLSIVSSPISGKSIRSLLLAKNPAATSPNRLPSRNTNVWRRFFPFAELWDAGCVRALSEGSADQPCSFAAEGLSAGPAVEFVSGLASSPFAVAAWAGLRPFGPRLRTMLAMAWGEAVGKSVILWHSEARGREPPCPRRAEKMEGAKLQGVGTRPG